MSHDYDLVITESGPAGHKAAIQAAIDARNRLLVVERVV
jgi:thioredoxin reductase